MRKILPVLSTSLLVLLTWLQALAQDGSIDTTFNYAHTVRYARENITGAGAGLTGTSASLASILSDREGGYFLRGSMASYNGFVPAVPIVRIKADGGKDTTFKVKTVGGTISGMELTQDGNMMLYGEITTYNAVRDSSLILIDRTGQRITTFKSGGFRNGVNNPSSISVVMPTSDGGFLVAGNIARVQSTTVRNFIKLDATGRLVSSFMNGLPTGSFVNGMTRYDARRIIIWGNFSTYAGTPVNYAARIFEDGTLDPTFTAPTFNFGPRTFSVRQDKGLMVTGTFTQVGTHNTNSVALLDSTGAVNTGFRITAVTGLLEGAVSIRPGLNILFGRFTSLNGSASNQYVVAANDLGQVQNYFLPAQRPDNNVQNVYVNPDGTLILGGSFTRLGNHLASRIVKVNRFGRYDFTFNCGNGANERIYKLREIKTGPHAGKFMAAGRFTHFNNRATGPLCRLWPDGTVDTSFFNNSFGSNATIYDLEFQADGKMIVGGQWVGSGAMPSNLVRINENATVDNTFNTGGAGPNSFVEHVEIDGNGRIWIAGFFNQYNGTARPGMARLQSTGALDNTFSPARGFERSGLGSVIPDVVRVLASGRIAAAGNFNLFNGTTINNIVVLQTNGVVAPNVSFGTGILSNGTQQDAFINDIQEQADGKLLIAGSFASYNGNSVNKVFRVNSSGSYDASFNPNQGNQASGVGNKIAIQRNGAVILTGLTMTFQNRGTAYWLVRLNAATGAFDTTFAADPNTVFNNTLDVALTRRGKILIGGVFLRVSGLYRGYGALMLNDDSCLTPVITQQPLSSIKCSGDSAVFTVSHSGNGPFLYRWYRGTTLVETTMTPRLVLRNLSPSLAGVYSVVVSGKCGVVTSSNATLTINSRPDITSTLSNATVCFGQPYSYTVSATGTNNSVRWLRNGTQVSTATTYSITSLAASDTGTYQVIVSNTCGADTSATVRLSGIAPTSITLLAQPLYRLCAGGRVVLKANVSGGYSAANWRRGTSSVSTLADSLVLPSLSSADTGSYTLQLTTPCGTVTSTVVRVQLIPETIIATQPQGLAVCQGTPLQLSVLALGDNLAYRWLQNGVLRFTQALPQIPSSAASDAGWWRVEVTGTCGTVRSDSVRVSIKQPTDTAVNATINQGDVFSFGGRQFTQSGSYLFTIPNRAGCDSVIVVNLTVLVSQAKQLPGISIGPNPTNGEVVITGLTDGGTVMLYDMLGKLVSREFLPANTGVPTRISLGARHAGAYLFKLITPAGTHTQQLIIRP